MAQKTGSPKATARGATLEAPTSARAGLALDQETSLNPLYALQATIGNQEVQRLVRNGRLSVAAVHVAPTALGNQSILRLLLPGRAGNCSPASQTDAPVVQRKVGFEFQMLDSDVTLYKGNKEAEGAVSWGNPAWHIENDGSNIEFVLKPVDDPGEAKKRVGEVAAVAKQVAKKGTYKQHGDRANSATNRIVVNTPDTSGQPQINSDIGLDRLVGGSLGYQSGSDASNKTYFGAEKESFKWSYGRTKEQMERVEKIRAAMAKFKNEDVLDYMQLDVGYLHDVPVIEAGPAVILKVTKLVRAYCITEAAVRETAPTSKGLTKDMPILPKLNLASVEREILDLLKKGLTSSRKFSAEQLAKLELRYRFEDIVAKLQEATESGRAKPDVFETTDTSRHVYGVKEPKDVDARKNYSMLMEYRRVPIKPVTDWETFAEQATKDFGKLD